VGATELSLDLHVVEKILSLAWLLAGISATIPCNVARVIMDALVGFSSLARGSSLS